MQFAPYFKNISGEHAPEPCKLIPPLFQKYFEFPPPPPRNEILDTPLDSLIFINKILHISCNV